MVMTMERCENDIFFVHTQLRVSLRDPQKYVLITDPAQAQDDPREAILVQPRQECVMSNLESGLRSFDLADTASASWRLYSQLEVSTYHLACFDMTADLQPDGSLLLRGTGDANKMQNLYDEGMVILTALTLTDRSGDIGRVEIFYRDLPSASYSPRHETYRLWYEVDGFHLGHADVYYRDGYAYLSVKFSMTSELPMPDTALLTAADHPAVNGLEAAVLTHADEYFRYSGGKRIIRDEYQHVIIRLDGLDTATDILYPTLTFRQDGNDVFSVQLASQNTSGSNAPTPAPTPSPTPAFTPAPTLPPEDFTIPADSKVLTTYPLEIVEKVQMYRHYLAKLRTHAEGYVLQPYFRFHNPLPEGTCLRLVEINGEAGDYGSGMVVPAELTDGPEDMLMARICLPSLPERKCTFLLEAIDPATDEVIFTVTLKTTSVVKPIPSGSGSSGSGSTQVTPYPNGVMPGTDTDFRLTDGILGDPAPTPYSPTYNYNNNNYGWNYGSGTSWIEEGMQINPPDPYGGWGW